MPRRLKITLVCFHVSAFVYMLTGLGLFIAFFMWDILPVISGAVVDVLAFIVGDRNVEAIAPMIPFLSVAAIIFSGVLEGTALRLAKLEHGAWKTGVVVSILMILSGFYLFMGNGMIGWIPIAVGGLSLWGLFDDRSIAAVKQASYD